MRAITATFLRAPPPPKLLATAQSKDVAKDAQTQSTYTVHKKKMRMQ